MMNTLMLCYCTTWLYVTCPEHYNQPASASSLGRCSTQMLPRNNQSKEQFHAYTFLHNLKNAPESYNFNQDFVAICIHLYHPAAAITPSHHVHCKMLFISIAMCLLIYFTLFVATLHLCVQVVLSVSKVGVNMRYQIWVTFKHSREWRVKKRIRYRQKNPSELTSKIMQMSHALCPAGITVLTLATCTL